MILQDIQYGEYITGTSSGSRQSGLIWKVQLQKSALKWKYTDGHKDTLIDKSNSDKALWVFTLTETEDLAIISKEVVKSAQNT